MKNILVFNGHHSSGKSTIARKMDGRDESEYIYFDEIGARLRKTVGFNTMDSVFDFDRAVMNEETERDFALLKCHKTPCVETWHVGNIAYAIERSPKIVNGYLDYLNNSLQYFLPFGIILKVNKDTFLQRASDTTPRDKYAELYDFFDKIVENTIKIYNLLDIKYTIIDNNGSNPDAVVEEINRLLTKSMGNIESF